jgi:hypothetical protein
MDISRNGFLDHEMMKEADRLKTFDNWPVSFISENDMSAAGFYFLGREDWVRCPFCGVQIGDWGPGDEPLSCHKRSASDCSFASGYFTQNIPIGSDIP